MSALKTVEGVFRDGKIELTEVPEDVQEARVIVTFLPRSKGIDLKAAGITEAEAARLRWGFGAGIEDWDRPEMDVYDEL